MLKKNRQIDNKAGYDLWSSFYDGYVNSTVAADERHFPRYWDHLQGKKILEIGCGTGRHTIRLVNQSNHVLGMDLSKGMLDQARRKLSGKSVRFIEGDFLRYDGLEQCSFDVGICSLVLEHIAEIPQFFRKLAFALAPAGEVFISEIHPQRIKNGTQANFCLPGSKDIHFLESHPHSAEFIEDSAVSAGFIIKKNVDVFGDETFSKLNPEWSKHLGKPLIKIWHLEKAHD
jgi:ubiquinone/menaquinone biosynthesis C-methylase UbiE